MLLLGLGLFGLYLYSAYPTLSPYRDAGDMAASALTLGVAHPPGYPVYALLSHAWLDTFRLGNPAFRLGVLSALLGAGACLVVLKAAQRDGAGRWALVAFLLLAFAPAFWHLSVVSEMYSLNALLAATLLWLALQGGKTGWRSMATAALLAGLGLGNHQSLALALPGLVWMRAKLPKYVAWLPLLFLLGLLLYAYLPLRSMTGPALSWGDPTSPSGFLRMLTRAEYGGMRLHPGRPAGLLGLSSWGSGLALAARAFLGQLGLAGTLLLGWGAWTRRRSSSGQGCLLAFLLTGPLFIVWANLDSSQPETSAILEPHLVLPLVFAAALAAQGARDLFSRVASTNANTALAMALVALWLLPRGSQTQFHRQDYSAWDYGQGLLASLEKGSLLLDPDDPTAFTLSYLLHAHGRRPDLVSVLYFRTRWGYEQLKRRHSELLPSWEIRSGQELLGTLVERNMKGRPLYVDLPQKAPPGLAAASLGLAYRLFKPLLGSAARRQLFERGRALDRLVFFRPASGGDFFTRHTASYWSSALNNLGIEAQGLGLLKEAAGLYRRSLAAVSDQAEAWNNWGNAELELRDVQAAEGCYLASIRLKPAGPVIYNLGRAYLLAGRYNEAETQFKRALLMADLPDAQNDLGLAYLYQLRIEEAVGQWLDLLSRRPDYALAYYNLGQAYAKLGRKADAAKAVSIYHQLVRTP